MYSEYQFFKAVQEKPHFPNENGMINSKALWEKIGKPSDWNCYKEGLSYLLTIDEAIGICKFYNKRSLVRFYETYKEAFEDVVALNTKLNLIVAKARMVVAYKKSKEYSEDYLKTSQDFWDAHNYIEKEEHKND